MTRGTLSADGLRLTLLAALASSVGCAEEAPAPGDDAVPVRGLMACLPDEDLGYPGSGVVRCQGGFLHREQALECQPELLRVGSPGYPERAPPSSSCFVDADCRQLPNGYCVLRGERLLCAYGCRQDADCAEHQLCLCTENLAGTCVAADCRTDADCAPGALCTGPRDLNGLVPRPEEIPVHFACQSPRDECAGDCFSGPCHYRPELERRVCGGPGAVPGRPFLIAGQARTAAVTGGHGWLAAPASAPHASAPHAADLALSPEQRARLVAYWLRAAQLEHASVAAFARFSLQLLSLGAPARLLEASAQAQQDEIRHAQAAFAVASHFSGGPLGPGPLALAGLECGEPFADIVVGTFIEGCVGETIAALEAAEALAGAEHPLVRAALAEVAHDEARHAELAWSFLAWASERSAGSLLPALRAACAAARLEATSDDGAGEQLTSFGVLGSARAARVRSDAWALVIEPCLAALADRSEASAGTASKLRSGAPSAPAGA